SEPTEAGRVFYERIKPAVAAIIEARAEAANLRGDVSGPLKVGAPILFASSYVAPIVSRFLELYPNVDVELRASDEQADLMAEGLDIAVRIGDSTDESLIARRLHALRVVVAGAPSYFAEHGRPQHPGDLEQHACILRAGTDVIDKWPFRIDGRIESIRVHGRFRSNSAASIRAAASEGTGLARLPLWQIGDLVAQGALAIVLAEFETEGMPIQLVWPPTRAPLERVRRPNQRRTKRLREQGVKGYPSEWPDSIALQAGQDVAGDPFGVAAAQERQQPGLRVGPPAFRAEQIFEFSKRQGILAIGQVGDDGGAAIIRQSA